MNNVEHPYHYNYCGIECMTVIKALTSIIGGFEGFCVGNIIKYVWRYKRKNGIEDLKKAKEYIDQLITYLEDENA